MDETKLPRIYCDYCDQEFGPDIALDLSPPHAHYFRSVMRRQDGDCIRLFNGRHGEWVGALSDLGKKTGRVVLQHRLRAQPDTRPPLALYFAPIKKSRLELLVEKAVELGVTDLYPILTANTQHGKINIARLRTQMIEAAEQCERMDVPQLHPLQKLRDMIAGYEAAHAGYATKCLHWCAERFDAVQPLIQYPQARAFLLGPEGGFDHDEKTFLAQQSFIQPVSLGETVLRAETAAIYCLSHASLHAHMLQIEM